MGIQPAHQVLHRECIGSALFAKTGHAQSNEQFLFDLLEDDGLRPVGVDGGVADAIDDFALLIEHVVVLQQPLANGVILLLDLLLRRFDRAVKPRMFELLAFLHRAFHQPGGKIALQEEPHQVVLE